MITDKALNQRQLDDLYDWVDSLALSRPKKNIARDFSDALLMAEVIYAVFPKIVQLHNYPPTNSIKSKVNNWVTLNNKVLSKIGVPLTAEDCHKLSNCTPMAVESLLYEFKLLAEEANRSKEEEDRRFPDPFAGVRQVGNSEGKHLKTNQIGNKQFVSSKVDELREVLSLLKEKINLVERSIERKDSHIRELEETLKMYSG